MGLGERYGGGCCREAARRVAAATHSDPPRGVGPPARYERGGCVPWIAPM